MTQKEISGTHTDATVYTTSYDENCGEQIKEMVNHPAFKNEVAIMPDTHYGAGAVIGFTMPIGKRIVPNTVGVDIGCGMSAANIGQPEQFREPDTDVLESIDTDIRGVVPMGRNVHSNPEYHIVNEFPWDTCQQTLEEFKTKWGFTTTHEYGKEYFLDLCNRVESDVNRVIASMGTLGGGNHFVELSQSQQTGDIWVVVHSGSRGIGLSIANYWQDRANELRDAAVMKENIEPWMWDYVKFGQNVSDTDLRQWVFGGKGEAFYDMDAVRQEFSGEEIERRHQQLKSVIPSQDKTDNLDWLEDKEAVGYFIDMVFAQQYAAENRRVMLDAVADTLDVSIQDFINSTHNYVDFEDGIIRKGATRAHKGERLIIPFNMRDGTILCKGRGNPNWNYSAPHGAGRRMSRTRAYEKIDFSEFKSQMSDVFSTSVTEGTLDEAPQAYKDTAVIESVIDETATIQDRWTPILNLKADE